MTIDVTGSEAWFNKDVKVYGCLYANDSCGIRLTAPDGSLYNIIATNSGIQFGPVSVGVAGGSSSSSSSANGSSIDGNLTISGFVSATTYYGSGQFLTGIGSFSASVEQVDYSCDNPIETSGNTISIGTESNAYGTRYVRNSLPPADEGCDGDLWYNTSGSFLGAVPTGAVFHFAASTPPTGYLKCNGDVVPNGNGTVQSVTTDFSALYAILGSTYGSAGQLPDLRAEFIRGWVDGRVGTADTARTFGSFQDHQLQEHTHTESYNVNSSGQDQAGSGSGDNDFTRTKQTAKTGTTGNFGSETRPRNVALLACIKY